MKNLLPICLALLVTSHLTFADSAPPVTQPAACVQSAADTESERVQLVLRSYAGIVHFYQNQIDVDTLQFLAEKTAELEAQLNATEEETLRSISQYLAFDIAQ